MSKPTTDHTIAVLAWEARLRRYTRCVKDVLERDLRAWDGVGSPPTIRSRYDVSYDHCRTEAGYPGITPWEEKETCLAF